MTYTKAMDDLIKSFTKFPGVGQRSAQRMAFHILRMQKDEVSDLAQGILKAKGLIHYCSVCNNLSESQFCNVCDSRLRQKDVICVVESPKDVACIEASGIFSGVYHVLLGVLSPLDGIGPKDLKVEQLYNRIKDNRVKEVIIALSSGIESEATVLYIVNLLKDLGVKLTRIASGVPVGTPLEYADKATLTQAFEGRSKL